MLWRCDLVPQDEAYQGQIDDAIQRVLRSGRYVLAENVQAFEEEFAAYIGANHGVGVNSGTDALILALESLDLRPGDEVITTSFTAIPTYSAIRRAGARPVLVDIDPETFLLELRWVERALTSRTRAVVPVHLFGNVVDVEALRQIVGPDIFILEDCAQSHGASISGKMAGSLGDASAFSFYPTKNLGAYGDGGAVLTNNAKLAEHVRLRRMYGMVNKDQFAIDGVNTRLDELQAAILRVKLTHLEAMNEQRRKLAAQYTGCLEGTSLRPQRVADNVRSAYHVYAAVASAERDALVAHLEREGIQSNVYYPMPLNRQKAHIASYGTSAALPNAEEIASRIIALPFYPELTESSLDRVVAAVCGLGK